MSIQRFQENTCYDWSESSTDRVIWHHEMRTRGTTDWWNERGSRRKWCWRTKAWHMVRNRRNSVVHMHDTPSRRHGAPHVFPINCCQNPNPSKPNPAKLYQTLSHLPVLFFWILRVFQLGSGVFRSPKKWSFRVRVLPAAFPVFAKIPVS